MRKYTIIRQMLIAMMTENGIWGMKKLLLNKQKQMNMKLIDQPSRPSASLNR